MDRGAWWATVHWVAMSGTGLIMYALTHEIKQSVASCSDFPLTYKLVKLTDPSETDYNWVDTLFISISENFHDHHKTEYILTI